MNGGRLPNQRECIRVEDQSRRSDSVRLFFTSKRVHLGPVAIGFLYSPTSNWVTLHGDGSKQIVRLVTNQSREESSSEENKLVLDLNTMVYMAMLTVMLLTCSRCARCGRQVDWPALDELLGSKSLSSLSTEGVLSFTDVVADSCSSRLIWRGSDFETIKCRLESKPACFDVVETHFKLVETMECKEHVKKDCTIEQTPSLRNISVQICDETLVHICDEDNLSNSVYDDEEMECRVVKGEECRSEYVTVEVEEDDVVCEAVPERRCSESNCGTITTNKCEVITTKVEKIMPNVDCRNTLRSVCGRANCPLQNVRKCRNETKTWVQMLPKESCNLTPRRECGPVIRLVPTLRKVQKCMDIQQEQCRRTKVNPSHVLRRHISNLCHMNNPKFDNPNAMVNKSSSNVAIVGHAI